MRNGEFVKGKCKKEKQYLGCEEKVRKEHKWQMKDKLLRLLRKGKKRFENWW